MKERDIDGVLVGGSSLNVSEFEKLLGSAARAKVGYSLWGLFVVSIEIWENREGIFGSFGPRCSRIDRACTCSRVREPMWERRLVVALQGRFLAVLEGLIS